MNSTSQKPNPAVKPDSRKETPEDVNKKRPPSTIGEIVMAVFVGATVVIYIILTCLTAKTMRVDQRAWVGFSEIESYVLEDGKPFAITIPLKNTGKTPAIKASAGLAPTIDKTGNRPDGDTVLARWMGTPGVVLLLPGQNQEMHTGLHLQSADGGLPEGTLDKLKSQEMTIWVFGKVTYADIFGFQHWTRYCYKTVYDYKEGIKFRPCEFYTGIDQEQE